MQAYNKAFYYENILEEGYIIEKDGETPFAACYEKAAKLVAQLLDKNEQFDKNFERNENPETRMHNVIPFIGRRGTGKTSAMFTFRDILAPLEETNLHSELHKTLVEKDVLLSKYTFVALKNINTEFLLENEDVIEIILAEMQQYLASVTQKNVYLRSKEEALRQLYWRFDKILKHLRFLNGGLSKPIEAGESALRILKELASSHSVEIEFRELVREYLNFLRSGSNQYCLVIVMDDVDLYHPDGKGSQKNAYDLLKRIYEFLMIPGVIVLISYDEDKIKNACEERFKKQNIQPPEMTQQFLQKMMPTYQRIYLPNYENIDLAEADDTRNILHIRISPERQKELFGGKNTAKEKILGSKELILRLIAQRTGIYFDMAGEKKHFLEERNLRALHDFLKNVVTLEPVVTDGKMFEKILANNRFLIKSYLYDSFASRMLTVEEKQLFKVWTAYPIVRRSREILKEIQRRIADIQGLGETQDQKTGLYSYGELAQSIYRASRLVYSPPKKSFQEAPFSKELVHCILFMYSVILNDLYADCLFAPSNSEKIKAKAELLKIIGPSVAGRWANEMFPIAVQEDISAKIIIPFKMGSVRISELSRAWKIPLKDSRGTTLSSAFEDKDKLEYFLEDIVRRVEWSGMFFTRIRYHGSYDAAPDTYCFEIETKKNEQNMEIHILRPILSTTGSITACFNIMNFCVNSFRWESYFAFLHKALKEAFINQLLSKGLESKIEEFERAFSDAEKHTMYSEYRKWSRISGDMALPIQNFDMSYNILKRLADKEQNGMAEEVLKLPLYMEQQDVESKWRKPCIDYYRLFLQNIKDALAIQDKNYGLKEKFTNAFETCPFVKTVFSAFSEEKEIENTWVAEEMIRLLSTVGAVAENTAQVQKLTLPLSEI